MNQAIKVLKKNQSKQKVHLKLKETKEVNQRINKHQKVKKKVKIQKKLIQIKKI